MLREFKGTDRFEVVTRLGEGGMGVVYEALDREQGTRVAIKTLRLATPELGAQLKNEFRAVQDLAHPNLIRLGELIDHEGTLFFTMELVDGVSFVYYVRGSLAADSLAFAPTMGGAVIDVDAGAVEERDDRQTFDEPRLRSVLTQLLTAIAELHRAGKVHRDIKPSNVLVTKNGRVVVLDFGLVADAPNPRESLPGELVGTAAYMSPEQAASRRAGPKADIYGIGCVLYEALTGRTPFRGKPFEIMLRKQREMPPCPSEIAGGIPADLDRLCIEMVATRPTDRPSAREALERLGVAVPEPTSSPPSSSGRGSVFVGRDDELRALEAAFADAGAGHAVTCAVYGAAGVGKSALLHRFLDRARHEALVLTGRCYERESLPFKALDGVVEALADHIAQLPPAEATEHLPRSLSLASKVFPTLRRLHLYAREFPVAHTDIDPREQRIRAFAAVRSMLYSVARKNRVVLAIEDMHWADADSLALLSEVLREPNAPAVLLIATARSGVGVDVVETTHRFTGIIHGDVRLLNVDHLPPAQAAELARQLLDKLDVPPPRDPEALAREANGHPLFIDELVRYLAHAEDDDPAYPSLSNAIWARITGSGADARRVLEMVAVAGAPIRLAAAAAATDLRIDELTRIAGELRVAHFARTTGARSDDLIEVYHDRLRAAVLDRLPIHDRKEWHRHIALAMEATTPDDAEAISWHYYNALLVDKAIEYALLAAESATSAFAFDRAARLYANALSIARSVHESGRRLPRQLDLHQILVSHGVALANAGQGERAADVFYEASETAEGAARLELRRLAAEKLLEAGRIDRGMDGFSESLALIGERMPATPRRALASLIARRVQLRLRGLGHDSLHESEVADTLLARVDLYWTAARTIGIVDYIYGAYFQTRHLAAALSTGEQSRVAMALCLEATYAGARSTRGAGRANRLLERASELANTVDAPLVDAMIIATRAMHAYLAGRWSESLAGCERAEQAFRERCVGSHWELGLTQLFTIQNMVYLGQLSRVMPKLSSVLAEAAERSNVTVLTNLRSGFINICWLALDDPVNARLHADDAIEHWSERRFLTQHLFDLVAQVHIDLYVGDADAALQRFTEMWPRLRRSLLLRIEFFDISLHDVYGRVAVTAAAHAPPRQRRRLLRRAEQCARRLERFEPGWARAMAAILRASIAHVRGDAVRAADDLRRAIPVFADHDMALHENLARWQLARLTRDDSARGPALAYAARERIVNPNRLAAVLVPLVFDDA